MKKLYIVANWKSNKTTSEAKEWLEKFDSTDAENKEIIVCPSFTLLPSMHAFIQEKKLPIKLGTQNISNFSEGAYTGEVNIKQAKEFVTHAIVGHSERRKYFHETDEDVHAKIKQLLAAEITPVLCISDMAQLDHYLQQGTELVEHAEKIIFVYEPPGAISGGGAFKEVGVEEANENAKEISNKIGKRVITLYGASINPENVALLFAKDNIDGGLIGQASLDPQSFSKLINS